MFKLMTAQQKIKFASEQVLLDAIEKGHTDKAELISYMQSDVFRNAVKSYLQQM